MKSLIHLLLISFLTEKNLIKQFIKSVYKLEGQIVEILSSRGNLSSDSHVNPCGNDIWTCLVHFITCMTYALAVI